MHYIMALIGHLSPLPYLRGASDLAGVSELPVSVNGRCQ